MLDLKLEKFDKSDFFNIARKDSFLGTKNTLLRHKIDYCISDYLKLG